MPSRSRALEDWLTVIDVARLIERTPSRVEQLLREQRLPYSRVGGRRVIHIRDVNAYLARQQRIAEAKQS
jgi:excisionase family DNA binding protein